MKDSSIKKAKESAKVTAKKTAKKAVKVTAKVTTATAATGLGGVLVGAAAGEAAGIALDKSDVFCSSRSLVHVNINTGIFEKELSVTIQKPVKGIITTNYKSSETIS